LASYLVTGGCGFIGSHLADALVEAGHGVRILDDLSTGKRANAPAEAELIVGDIADAGTVTGAMQGMAGCFHLAAIASVARSVDDWLGTHRVNQTGSINVFDAARSTRGGTVVPVVYASSAAVYGDNPNVPLSEDAEKRPLTAYGADKYGCELHARVASHVHGVPTLGLRFFNVYGPRQDPRSPYSGVISIFADCQLAGRPIDVHGDGGQVRDFVYVGDVVAFLRAAMDKARAESQVLNVCTGMATSVLDLASAIGDVVGRSPQVSHVEARPGDIRTSIGDPARAAEKLGLRAKMPLLDGLRMTLKSLVG
jgi:UDP-glucose 4-epimerase